MNLHGSRRHVLLQTYLYRIGLLTLRTRHRKPASHKSARQLTTCRAMIMNAYVHSRFVTAIRPLFIHSSYPLRIRLVEHGDRRPRDARLSYREHKRTIWRSHRIICLRQDDGILRQDRLVNLLMEMEFTRNFCGKHRLNGRRNFSRKLRVCCSTLQNCGIVQIPVQHVTVQ